MQKSVFVQTYGCQMNERDSEEVLGMLTAQGYEIAEVPEAADVILVNTCSVREHAEERAFGRIGELSGLKRDKPELVLGVIGCMAKLQQEAIFKRVPQVDLIAGPAELYDLPYLLAEIQEKRQLGGVGRETGGGGTAIPNSAFRIPNSAKVLAVGREYRPLEKKPSGDYRSDGVTAFVTIMEGCDKACTYCIVPKTRGQEVSRPVGEILAEIRALVEAGYRDITLLGQNVNSYGKRFPDGSGYQGPLGRRRLLEVAPPSLIDFPALLRRIDEECRESAAPPAAGERIASSASRQRMSLEPRPPVRSRPERARSWWPLRWPASARSERLSEPLPGRSAPGVSPIRIRFTTSHPFDATERLFEAMRDCASVCEWLHLPVQSGSNRILRAMRRGYTAEAYLEKIALLRRLVPNISLSTDIIVGFPGETEEDFEATERLMREVRYDSAYIFKYSPRPGTDAAAREDDVPQEVKEERNQWLLALQSGIERAGQDAWVGREAEVLFERPGKQPGQWFGRTRGNHGVIVEQDKPLAGQCRPVRISRAASHTLFGDVCYNGAACHDTR
jgi:tRNA-2-methylthio-N6-dimethylallyladenosine synthase